LTRTSVPALGSPDRRRRAGAGEVVAETFRAVVKPESIDRLPLPAGRESVFELLCVVRLLDALHGILLEAKRGAQSFGDTVHQLKA
jgi:hypothetical protein